MASTHPFRDPMGSLAAQGAGYEWALRSSLELSDRYRSRQLPLIGREGLGELRRDSVQAPEFWPPVRSVVAPLDHRHVAQNLVFSTFLQELEASAAGHLVWWEGVTVRAARLHATLAGDVGDAADDWTSSPRPPLQLTVLGPWMGAVNSGRIYLPVAARTAAAVETLESACRRANVAPRVLLAGYLQLTDDVRGEAYLDLRRIIQHFQHEVSIRVDVGELWLMDTMDDLVLRADVVRRIQLSPQGRLA